MSCWSCQQLGLLTLSIKCIPFLHIFNPCIKVQSWACQYFSISRKTLSASTSWLIEVAKTTCPNQNAISLSNKEVSHAGRSLLRNSPSSIPTPIDINWYSLRRDFDIFVKKIRYRVSKPTETSSINVNNTTNISNSLVRRLGNPPIETKSSNINFRKEKTKISSLEAFIEIAEKDLFKPSNYNKIKGNITTEEGKALNTI